ncbi:hypothetical protein Hanom_Chr03g00274461 [Helianthus anomalus]
MSDFSLAQQHHEHHGLRLFNFNILCASCSTVDPLKTISDWNPNHTPLTAKLIV